MSWFIQIRGAMNSRVIQTQGSSTSYSESRNICKNLFIVFAATIAVKCQIHPLIGNYKKAVTSIKAHYIPLAVLAQYTPPADTEWSMTVLQKTTNSISQTAQRWAADCFLTTGNIQILNTWEKPPAVQTSLQLWQHKLHGNAITETLVTLDFFCSHSACPNPHPGLIY